MRIQDLKVLIVDDVEAVRNVFEKKLKKLGVSHISQSDSLLDSWEKIQDACDQGDAYDIIFCDWNMPKGDGIFLLQRVRECPKTEVKLVKFIMVTGSNEKVLEAMDNGANNIIHKPFTEEIILKKLELIYSQEFKVA